MGTKHCSKKRLHSTKCSRSKRASSSKSAGKPFARAKKKAKSSTKHFYSKKAANPAAGEQLVKSVRFTEPVAPDPAKANSLKGAEPANLPVLANAPSRAEALGGEDPRALSTSIAAANEASAGRNVDQDETSPTPEDTTGKSGAVSEYGEDMALAPAKTERRRARKYCCRARRDVCSVKIRIGSCCCRATLRCC